MSPHGDISRSHSQLCRYRHSDSARAMLPRLARSCADEDRPLRLLRSGAGDDRAVVSDETLRMRVEGAIGRELLCQYWGTSDTGETEAQYMTRIVLALSLIHISEPTRRTPISY